MAGQNVPLMLTQGITVTNDSLVHFMPDTTPRAAKKVYLVFLSLSAVWTLGVWGAAGELIHDLRSKLPVLDGADCPSKSKVIGLPFLLKFPVLEGAYFPSKSKVIGLPFLLKLPVLEGADFPSKSKAIGLSFFAKITCFGRS